MPTPVKTVQAIDVVLIAMEKAIRLRIKRPREKLMLDDAIRCAEEGAEIPVYSVLLIREMAKRYDAAMDPILADPSWPKCLSKVVTEGKYEE